MKATRKLQPTVTLELDLELALWLKAMVQNALVPDEDARDAKAREAIWSALDLDFARAPEELVHE